MGLQPQRGALGACASPCLRQTWAMLPHLRPENRLSVRLPKLLTLLPKIRLGGFSNKFGTTMGPELVFH